MFSYAGRTAVPRAQPLPMRVGGFGGVAGLLHYLRHEDIGAVIDATHPFAAGMSRNAVAACHQAGIPLAAFERAPWQAGRGDDWQHVADVAGAVAALPAPPARVFLAIGKQNLEAFAHAPQHRYLLRLVDPPEAPLPLPDSRLVIARGPFSPEGDLALMTDQGVELVVAKNAGGTGAQAKLEAARKLGLRVIMIDRPRLPARPGFDRLEDILHWLDHTARLGV